MSEVARVTPPDLNDTSKFVKVGNAPIFDTHVRHSVDPKTGQRKTTFVGSDQLKTIAENTNRRIENGEFPMITIGHSLKPNPDPTKNREIHQPPRVGYAKDLRIGTYKDKPAILADIYVDRHPDLHHLDITYDQIKELKLEPYEYVLSQFPRRSVEVFDKMEKTGYIDIIALLKRAPERDLGYLTYQNGKVAEFYSMDTEINAPPPTPSSENANVAAPDEALTDPNQMDPNAPPAVDPGDEMAENAAIDKIATALAIKICANEGLSAALSVKISEIVAAQVSQQIAAGRSQMPEQAPDPAAGGAGKPEAKPEVNAKDNENPATDEKHKTMNPPPKKKPPFGSDKEDGGEKKEKYEGQSGLGYPSGTNTKPAAPEIFQRDDDMETNEELIVQVGVLKTQNEKLIAVNTDLVSRLESVERYQKENETKTRNVVRRVKLEKLVNDGYEFDIDAKLEKYESREDAEFYEHTSDIESNWRRSPAGATPVQTVRMNGSVQNPSAKKVGDDEITEDEVKGGAVERYMRENADKYPMNMSAMVKGPKVIADYLADRKRRREAKS